MLSKLFVNRPDRRRTWTVEWYSPGGATVHHTWYILLPWSHPSPIPNGISIGSAIFEQLTAVSHCTSQQPHLFTLKIVISHGASGPHLIHDTLGPFKPTSQTASRLAELTAVSLYLTMDRPSPSELPLSIGEIWTPSSTWFLGPTRVLNPNGSVIFCTAH